MPEIIDTTWQLFGLVIVGLIVMFMAGLMLAFMFAYSMRIISEIAGRIRLGG